jgi:hypothetical protein
MTVIIENDAAMVVKNCGGEIPRLFLAGLEKCFSLILPSVPLRLAVVGVCGCVCVCVAVVVVEIPRLFLAGLEKCFSLILPSVPVCVCVCAFLLLLLLLLFSFFVPVSHSLLFRHFSHFIATKVDHTPANKSALVANQKGPCGKTTTHPKTCAKTGIASLPSR